MAFATNQHVERLSQYQPFDANFSQLFAEYVDTRQSDQISTNALSFVERLVDLPNCRLVILTGDAGHGKTHLCGQLIRAKSSDVSDVRTVLHACADGTSPVAELGPERFLHIVKDLSELDPEVGATRLEQALAATDRVTVVCANEGRLRDVISRRRVELREIQSALDNVLRSGQTSSDSHTWIVDLNHQSVSADGDRSLTRQALRNWVGDKRKWAACDQCDAQTRCPIYENRRVLADEGERGNSRRLAIETLLRIAEQTGHVITIRELLVFVAHIVSGGLRCGDVHGLVTRRKEDDWQYQYLFHEAAFAQLIGQRELSRLTVFRAMQLLDPGERASRPVDDNLMPRSGQEVGRFLPPERRPEGLPRSTREQREAAREEQKVFRFLRRRAYFDALVDGNVDFSERLGFRHHAEFESIREGVDETETVQVRDRVLSGLEALQGARRPSNQGSFAVVDPAFSSHRGNASVVALQIPKAKVRLLSQTSWWIASGFTPDLTEAVDWVNRRIYVVMPDAENEVRAIELDCRQFELVCRAASGLMSRAFFQADIRRIGSQLAAVARNARPTDEITVLVKGQPTKLVIDVGNVIVATGA